MKTLYTGIKCHDPAFVHTPLIEIRPVADDSGLRAAARALATYDYLLLTSRHAVAALVRYVAVIPQPLHIVSIGNTTTEALRQAGVTSVEQVEHDNSYGVIDWFRNKSRGRVLIPRSNLALDIIPKGLHALGYEVTTLTAYENHLPEKPQKVDLRQIDRIVFTSPSTIDNFISLYGALPTDKQLTARGPITAHYLQTKIKEQNL